MLLARTEHSWHPPPRPAGLALPCRLMAAVDEYQRRTKQEVRGVGGRCMVDVYRLFVDAGSKQMIVVWVQAGGMQCLSPTLHLPANQPLLVPNPPSLPKPVPICNALPAPVPTHNALQPPFALSSCPAGVC